MTLTILFWVLMLFWLAFGSWVDFQPNPAYAYRGARNLLVFALFVILGWAIFGAPVHGGR